MTLLTSTFPGIVSQNPDLLVPLFVVAASFGVSGLIGLGVTVRDSWFRRS